MNYLQIVKRSIKSLLGHCLLVCQLWFEPQKLCRWGSKIVVFKRFRIFKFVSPILYCGESPQCELQRAIPTRQNLQTEQCTATSKRRNANLELRTHGCPSFGESFFLACIIWCNFFRINCKIDSYFSPAGRIVRSFPIPQILSNRLPDFFFPYQPASLPLHHWFNKFSPSLHHTSVCSHYRCVKNHKITTVLANASHKIKSTFRQLFLKRIQWANSIHYKSSPQSQTV